MPEIGFSNKMKLYNHYKGPIKTQSYYECWSECSEEEKCIAASYCRQKPCTGECFLYKKDEYLVTTNNSFMTFFYATERLDQANNNASTPVAVYVNQQIRNSYYKLVKRRNVRECWMECRAEANCRAAAFYLQNSLSSCQTWTCDCYLIAPLKTRLNNQDTFITSDSNYYISVSYSDEPFKKQQQQRSNNYSG